MKYRHIHWQAILEWSAVGLIIGGVAFAHQSHRISQSQHSIRTAKMITAKNNHDAKRFTLSHLIAVTDATQPNVGALMSSNKAQLNKGLKLAFNDCHTKSEYMQNKPKIKKLLGDSLSGKILPIIAPEQMNGVSKPQSLSNDLTECNISYGQYNKLGADIPLSITIKYDTPSFDQYAGIGGSFTHHSTVHTGYIMINAMYFTGKQNVEVDNAYGHVSTD